MNLKVLLSRVSCMHALE